MVLCVTGPRVAMGLYIHIQLQALVVSSSERKVYICIWFRVNDARKRRLEEYSLCWPGMYVHVCRGNCR